MTHKITLILTRLMLIGLLFVFILRRRRASWRPARG